MYILQINNELKPAYATDGVFLCPKVLGYTYYKIPLGCIFLIVRGVFVCFSSPMKLDWPVAMKRRAHHWKSGLFSVKESESGLIK